MQELSNTKKTSQDKDILKHDLTVLKEKLTARIGSLTQNETKAQEQKRNLTFSIPQKNSSPYADFLIRFQIDDTERIILLLALIPHLQPDFFEAIILEHFPQGGDLPEIGGAKGKHHRGMMPTGQTAVFLLSEETFDIRQQLFSTFSKDHSFSIENILYLESVPPGEPKLSGRILLSEEYADYLITGSIRPPSYGPDFPAQLHTTKMNWSDLVLHPYTEKQIEAIKRWLYHHSTLEEDSNLSRKIKPGFRILFYGPPGTGKTLTAILIGKEFKKPVYRIDLSQIVSKYIGETEKNLNKVFDRAQDKEWILFFDEADALFGKRTSVQSAHDKYANQETAFLLQRIEDYPSLIILASNFKANIDQAFLRRFQVLIHFPMPGTKERLQLWEQSLPITISFDKTELQLNKLAFDYEISGAAIINVMQYACLKALSKKDKTLNHNDLVSGIRREIRKEEG